MTINKIISAFNGYEYGFTIAEYECKRNWLTDKLDKKLTDVMYASVFPIFKVKEGEYKGEIFEIPDDSCIDYDTEVEECGWWGWGYHAEEPVELKNRTEAIKFLVNEGKRLNLWNKETK